GVDVILRTVFGLDEGPAKRELRAALLDLLNVGSNPQLLLAAQQSNGNGASPAVRFTTARERVDRLLFAEIASRRRADVAHRSDIPSLPVQAAYEGGPPPQDPAPRDRPS